MNSRTRFSLQNESILNWEKSGDRFLGWGIQYKSGLSDTVTGEMLDISWNIIWISIWFAVLWTDINSADVCSRLLILQFNIVKVFSYLFQLCRSVGLAPAVIQGLSLFLCCSSGYLSGLEHFYRSYWNYCTLYVPHSIGLKTFICLAMLSSEGVSGTHVVCVIEKERVFFMVSPLSHKWNTSYL